MIIGGYTLDLYCDGGKQTALQVGKCPNKLRPWESCDASFAGTNEADCRRQARLSGWKLYAGKAICPRCAKERK